jgi:molybdopterin molybdotransferase
MPGLTPLPEALRNILGQVPSPPEPEDCELSRALGRVLAADILAPINVPAADNSAMDGYAVRAQDLPGTLSLSLRITAGSDPGMLPAGTAARLFTGALLPEGADTVVMQEDAIERDGEVTILGCITPGAHVRRRGADITAGTVIAGAGEHLTPQRLGVLASVGVNHVSVRRPLRVAVLSTGDELVDAAASSASIAPWQIYNSNRPQLLALLASLGYEPIDLGTLPDDPTVIGDALEQAAASADCLLSSGGVSVGEADYVREQIEARGELALWKLAIKPGKPLAFGRIGAAAVFGLPGNPVSAWATFLLVVKPWLAAAQGARANPPRRVSASADFVVERPGTREEYLRVKLEGEGESLSASLAGSQSSGVLSSVSEADALAIVPIGTTIARGDPIEVLLLESLQSAATT